ncbi:MAG: hydantoinase/carbamoylase family amidase [Proteobacteria bacterium]|nr:hydantoinase/carbamoylase family amidase [Pseudomonadota bacterium]
MTAVAIVQPATEQPPLKDIATELFAELRRRTADEVGVTRECYAQGENHALDLYGEVARANGLHSRFDAVANLVLSMPGDDGSAPALALVSHADSVPQGGNYDGSAGVIAGLLCLIRLKRENREPPCPVRVMALRGEESAFYGRANIGARALFGRLDANDLAAQSRGSGRTLREAMIATGIDVARVERQERLVSPDQFLAYLELHIEQGPVMIARKLPTAIVTGIRGNLRHRRIVCRGEAGHSGAVPRWLRRDAVMAVADLLMRLDEHWNTLLERGLDLVVTAGMIGTDPTDHAISRIPGEVHFSFELRSQSRDTLESVYELFRSECRAVSDLRHVGFVFDDRVYTAPARMDENIVRKLVGACEKLGLPPELLASGAGHDAAIFANEGVASGMIFVRNANGSHNPREAMDIDDFMKGVDIMFAIAVGGI